jgi:SAM-dependent methyltransferase
MHVFLARLVAITITSASGTGSADSVLALWHQQAQALTAVVHTELARNFLAATATLPKPPIRTIYRDSITGAWFSATEADSQPEPVRSRLRPHVRDGSYYYQFHYGTFLNYLRVLELLGDNGIERLEGKRVLDFGYGRAGHLRVLASLGANVVGIDVDPELRALYSDPGDQGSVPGFKGRAGSLALITGSFPGDPAVRSAVGGAYDLVLSKNTLKGGHEPAQRARQSQIVNLGVSDSVFVHAMFESLKPGGLFIMYTVSSPRGNAHCPFPDTMLRSAGFDIVAFDRDDTPGAREMRHVLDTSQGSEPAEPADDSIALYTLLRRPR